MYYKEHIPIIKRDDLCTLCEDIQLWKLEWINRSPSQTQDEFEEFCNDLKLLLSNVNDANATLSVITGGLNAKLSSWQSVDKDNSEGRQFNSLTCACGYIQLINKATHVTIESSSCIDLIFAISPISN